MVSLPVIASVIRIDIREEVIIVALNKAFELSHGLLSPVDFIKPIASCANHDIALTVFYDRKDTWSSFDTGEMILNETVVLVVVAHQSQSGAYPQGSITGDKKRRDGITINRSGILVVMEIIGEVIPVITAQAIVGAYPNQPIAILCDTVDQAARQLIAGYQKTIVGL